MIAFPGMLVGAAEAAGMKVPPDPEDFDREEYVHFEVFTMVQLGARMPSPDSHWRNAELIASLSEDEIKAITYPQLLMKGLDV